VKRVEILAIGDELLRGIVQESNSHWLAKRIAARGASLTRVLVLPDDVEVVAAELTAAFVRAPDLLITHGGLGPTDDDRTRTMIAKALGVPQVRDDEALAIVTRRYAELAAAGNVGDAALNDARARMADLPHGARPYDNQVGTAPAFGIVRDATTLIALPGVPPELAWIWEHSLAPALDEVLGPGGFAEQTYELQLRDESRIAYLMEEIARAHPQVYAKSRARGFEAGEEVRVTLAAGAASDEHARALVDAAAADLRAALRAEGVELHR
jgi:molybdenum cofactor synthesis domain-containing protein